jgi:hypothetical protein
MAIFAPAFSELPQPRRLVLPVIKAAGRPLALFSEPLFPIFWTVPLASSLASHELGGAFRVVRKDY